MSLPEPYRTWFETVVGCPPPEEPLATCDACPMCARGTLRPTVKCCGYAPAVPNFRAGQALIAGGLAADTVRRRLSEGRPTGAWLLPTETEAARHAELGTLTATEADRCPYLTDDVRCAIWAFRNGTCSAFFCLHEAGDDGARLWHAATELFQFVEGGIAVLVADGTSEDDYIRAAEAFGGLDWDDVRRIGGSELAELEQALREAAANAGLPTPYSSRGPRR